ncbi:MAG TPA: hypothetical protein PLX90_10990 [Anaerolineales bacterium]|mgnify:CR=1 FL=1|nr:hypothetical protein [Anaerolineales bacterium]
MTAWRNRIVRYGTVFARDLIANPRNWRTHPRNQAEALVGILDQVGWVQDVIINLRTGEEWGEEKGLETMIDGHLRAVTAYHNGEETEVPVKYVDLSPEEEALILATLDPITALAGVDKDRLEEILSIAKSEDGAVNKLLNDLRAVNGFKIPDVDFEEFTEDIEQEVEYHVCPACGHNFPK